MNLEDIIEFCLCMPGSYKDFPFDEKTLVFKNSSGKIFCLVGEETPPHILLKCNPDEAEFLRSQYQSVKPGYHMNKKHWNSVICDGSVPVELVRQMILNSYSLVCNNKRSISI